MSHDKIEWEAPEEYTQWLHAKSRVEFPQMIRRICVAGIIVWILSLPVAYIYGQQAMSSESFRRFFIGFLFSGPALILVFTLFLAMSLPGIIYKRTDRYSINKQGLGRNTFSGKSTFPWRWVHSYSFKGHPELIGIQSLEFMPKRDIMHKIIFGDYPVQTFVLTNSELLKNSIREIIHLYAPNAVETFDSKSP